jgi:thymidylate synthase
MKKNIENVFQKTFLDMYSKSIGFTPFDQSVELEQDMVCKIDDFEDVNPDFSTLYLGWEKTFEYEREYYENLFSSLEDRIVGEINSNLGSRKLYFNLWSENDVKIDVKSPCLTAIYFRVLSGNVLNMSVVMRANNAFKIFPINLILFVNFFKQISNRVGMRMGMYTHHALSFHIYKHDLIEIENSVYLKKLNQNI